ncbi:MAG: DUF5131 family protein [Planctomycetota bacterium]
MSQTKIEWTDKTCNCVGGCSPVSDGCLHCAAARSAQLCVNRGNDKYKGLVKNGKWTGEVRLFPDELKNIPKGKSKMIFIPFMGDLFHKDVPFEFIDKVVNVFEKCPQHTGQILTKREKRLLEYSKYRNFDWPDNIIGMVTAENQPMADLRIPYLLQCGFKTTSVSVEPMLGAIDLSKFVLPQFEHITGLYKNSAPPHIKPDWVIIGSESLPGRRAGRFQDYFRCFAIDLVRQCKAAGIAVFVKQIPLNGKVEKDINKFPEELQVREYPKTTGNKL